MLCAWPCWPGLSIAAPEQQQQALVSGKQLAVQQVRSGQRRGSSLYWDMGSPHLERQLGNAEEPSAWEAQLQRSSAPEVQVALPGSSPCCRVPAYTAHRICALHGPFLTALLRDLLCQSMRPITLYAAILGSHWSPSILQPLQTSACSPSNLPTLRDQATMATCCGCAVGAAGRSTDSSAGDGDVLLADAMKPMSLFSAET